MIQTAFATGMSPSGTNVALQLVTHLFPKSRDCSKAVHFFLLLPWATASCLLHEVEQLDVTRSVCQSHIKSITDAPGDVHPLSLPLQTKSCFVGISAR